MFTRRDKRATDLAANAPTDDRLRTPSQMSHEVEAEAWRANRYGHTLVIVAMAPQLLVDEQVSPAELGEAVPMVAERVRRSDRVAVIAERAIVCLLPETDESGGRSAGHRLVAHLMLCSRASKRRNWTYAVSEQHGDAATADDLITTALRNALGE